MRAKAELLHQTGLLHEFVDSHFDEMSEKKAGECLEIIKALWAKMERRAR